MEIAHAYDMVIRIICVNILHVKDNPLPDWKASMFKGHTQQHKNAAERDDMCK